jgi:hypothetical protein
MDETQRERRPRYRTCEEIRESRAVFDERWAKMSRTDRLRFLLNSAETMREQLLEAEAEKFQGSPFTPTCFKTAPRSLCRAWQLMRTVGGTVPPEPSVTDPKRGYPLSEGILRKIRVAVDEIIRWCSKHLKDRRDNGPTELGCYLEGKSYPLSPIARELFRAVWESSPEHNGSDDEVRRQVWGKHCTLNCLRVASGRLGNAIHGSGWDIRVVGGRVFLTPPDPQLHQNNESCK